MPMRRSSTRCAFSLRFLALLLASTAAELLASNHVDLSVRGVTLGSPKPKVIASLGKPSRIETDHDSEMGMGDTLELTYPELTVELCKPDGHPPTVPPATEFHVWRILVTGSRWKIAPGLRIGMTRKALESVLGKPDSSETKGSVTTLHFSPFKFDAWIWVDLRKDIVVGIGMAEDWA